jgi:hypothetical protein
MIEHSEEKVPGHPVMNTLIVTVLAISLLVFSAGYSYSEGKKDATRRISSNCILYGKTMLEGTLYNCTPTDHTVIQCESDGKLHQCERLE